MKSYGGIESQSVAVPPPQNPLGGIILMEDLNLEGHSPPGARVRGGD